MTVYGRQIASAKRMIKAKGAACTWRQPSDAEPDAEKPWQNDGADDPAEFPVSIVFDRDTKAAFIALIKGLDVPEGAEVGVMHAVEFTPTIRDLVIRPTDSATLRVAAINPIQPDGVPIIYLISFEA